MFQAEVNKIAELSHPNSADLCFIYGVVFTDSDSVQDESRQLIVFGEKQVISSVIILEFYCLMHLYINMKEI